MKEKYGIYGFKFLYEAFKKYAEAYDFEYYTVKSSRFDFVTSFLYFKKLQDKGVFKKYDILHINAWENILQCKKNPKQILIFEMHGFALGLNFDATINEIPLQKRIPSKILKLALDKKMKKQFMLADIFYVSTPNMLEHAKKIRPDAIWLPNPISTCLFRSEGPKVRLEGNPAVFLPTRLHAFKNPLFALNLFKKIKAKYPEAKLHMIRYGAGADPLFNTFQGFVNPEDVIYHDRMPQEELTKYYRSADLVLGQFNPNLGNLSMVELEAMACGAPIVTLDKYEIKNELSSLDSMEKLAFKLIENNKFKEAFVKRNSVYVIKVHGEKAVTAFNNSCISKIINESRKDYS